jgi:acid phosphatase type 7
MVHEADRKRNRRVGLVYFLNGLLGVSFVVAALTGVVAYTFAGGSDFEVAADPVWGVVKWYLLDVHVVLSLLLVLLIPMRVMAGYLVPTPSKDELKTPKRYRLLPTFLGVLAGLLLVNHVVDEHPILVEDVGLTAYVSGATPEQIVLTWSGDPSTTQTIQWRTSATIPEGMVRYLPADAPQDAPWKTVTAATHRFEQPQLANDPVNMRHIGVARDLLPGARYRYQVGHGDSWSSERFFETAPATDEDFSFVYFGDVQIGFEAWGGLLEAANAGYPEAAFYVLAGDLVNSGEKRNEWDAFFHYGGDYLATRPLVPAIGNHDDDNEGSTWIYRDLFALPENGPEGIASEQAYSFAYGGAFFVVLNSNLEVDTQTAWLEQQLAACTSAWKFVIFHHPAYSSKSSRDNPEIRDEWCPIFEKHGVDVVLQGHDHAYLRTFPMKNEKNMGSPAEGPIYVVATAGTKYYDMAPRDYAETAYEELSTYQVIDIAGKSLHYRAFDLAGKAVDEFRIEK